MGIFDQGIFNGKFQSQTEKPIAGTAVEQAYTGSLTPAKVTATIVPGTAVTATVGSPLNITTAAANTSISGFAVIGDSDYVADGSQAGVQVAGQLVNFAQLGRGTKVYLPVKAADLTGGVITAFKWNIDNGYVEKTTGVAFTATLLSGPIDGQKISKSGDNYVFVDCSVALFQI